MTHPITEPTQSIRERLSRHLFDHDAALLASLGNPTHEQWPTSSIGRRQSYYDQIDAILSELMEPSEGMRQKGERAWMDRRLDDPESEPIRDCWQAMLQHIRGGGK